MLGIRYTLIYCSVFLLTCDQEDESKPPSFLLLKFQSVEGGPGSGSGSGSGSGCGSGCGCESLTGTGCGCGCVLEWLEDIMLTNTRRNAQSVACPSCGHQLQLDHQSGIDDLPGLPCGVKFDPTDQEILEHLEAKREDDGMMRSHPLIDEFIQTLQGENGICYTHPEKLPGVSKDGQVRHFFHRPSKAYTTGTRKRRKVHSGPDDSIETRWHKTGKTRPIFANGVQIIKGFKKILVLYTNYGRQKKPQKTNWVMHQYHLGNSEEEKDGELVVSKVFYQTQPRQSGSTNNKEDKQTSDCYDDQGLSSRNGVEEVSYGAPMVNPDQYSYYSEAGLISSFPTQYMHQQLCREETQYRLF